MMPPSSDITNPSLGELLRETRTLQGITLEEVADETKISPKNLQAMEGNDFANLPAEAFARGFYALYAKTLDLDAAEVLTMYRRERRNLPKESHEKLPPPYKLAQNVRNLADPPNSLPFAYFGLILLLLLVFGAFLCWYFSWNPASYLSQKLRSLDAPGQAEQAMKHDGPTPGRGILAPAPARGTATVHPDLFSLPSAAQATVTAPQSEQRPPAPRTAAGPTPYHVNALFLEATKLSLKLDDQPRIALAFKEGERVSWRAAKSIVVTLPADTRTKISLNEVPINLPKTNTDSLTLTIPEDPLR
jgi:cytoskeletal protein RodZ